MQNKKENSPVIQGLRKALDHLATAFHEVALTQNMGQQAQSYPDEYISIQNELSTAASNIGLLLGYELAERLYYDRTHESLQQPCRA